MDRYQRVEKPRDETPINENEIRITSQGRMRNYITYATSMLQEKDSNEIILKAMGRAINKTIMIVELIKRIVDLHQNTAIGSADITDTWEPLEEGLLLFQPPLPKDEVKPLGEFGYGGEGSPVSRGRGHGGRGRGRAHGDDTADYGDGRWDNKGRGYGRGGYSSGRGRGFVAEVAMVASLIFSRKPMAMTMRVLFLFVQR
ncbi:unnamed protein product [Musa acuminata subsp. burmannicoides]